MSKKIYQPVFILLFVCSAFSTIQAQYGYGNNSYRRQQRSSLPQAQTVPKEPEVKTPEQIADEAMPVITAEIDLNPFEQAVVRSILLKSIQKQSELQILELEPKKFREEYEKLRKKQDEELKAGLPEDKYEAFKKLQENRFKKSKKKKKKKSKN